MVKREEYLNKLFSWKDEQVIKVVSGIRRCGKSTLLKQYIDMLAAQSVDRKQIIYLNLEEPENDELYDYKKLYKCITKRLCKDRYTYIFLDEIQKVDGFEKAVDSLYVKDKVDIYITGSNAYLFSGELATLLSGRYVEISMLPLSSDSPASDRFWSLHDRINNDKKKKGVVVQNSRSEMHFNILSLLKEGAIDMSDLNGFSADFVQNIERLMSWSG